MIRSGEKRRHVIRELWVDKREIKNTLNAKGREIQKETSVLGGERG